MRPMSFAKVSTAAAAGLVLAAAIMAAPAPARAGDDDDVAPDVKILRGILEGIGLESDRKEMIDYHERPPLVIPGDKVLPPPEKTDAIIANNPAWPKDPDVKRRREAEKQAKKGVTSAEIDAWSRPLSPTELTPGGNPRTPPPRVKTSVPAGAEGKLLTPSELGYRGGLFDIFGNKREAGTASFTGEPARTSLTEPPPGYQTPSPDQPYGQARSDSAPKAADATHLRIEAAKK